MSDPPGVQAALGIEAVEWWADGENLIVGITGRWRRRRPAIGGQPTLVVESQGSRHRFPATPEPPGLTGTGPGIWRISFTVPAALAPDVATRSWLLFGGVVVRLPEAVEVAQAEAGAEKRTSARAVTGGETRAEGGARAAELVPRADVVAPHRGSEPPADLAPPERRVEPPADLAPPERRVEPPADLAPPERGREPPADAAPPERGLEPQARLAELAAAELAGRIEEFERGLARARIESGRLLGSLADRTRERRAIEQLAHAERVRRLEVEEELTARQRDEERSRMTLAELGAAEDRVRQLEHEMTAVRRQADEAEQVAAAACAARERTERREAERALSEEERDLLPLPIPIAQRRGLSRERELVALRSDAASRARVPSEPSFSTIVKPAPPVTDSEPVPADAPLESMVEALKAEVEARAASEARLRARLGVAEGRFETRVDTEAELAATLAQLRAELASLHTDLEHERAARTGAELRAAELERTLGEQRTRTDRANTAIEELRQAVEGLRATSPRSPMQVRSIAPERFSDALVRLRETIAPADGAEPAEEPAEVAASPEPTPDDPASEPEAPRLQIVGRPWLARAFTALARKDAARAGRLLLDLLPAQGVAYDGAVVYDLVLGRDVGTIAVTLRDGQLELASRSSAREPAAVDFQAIGSPGRIARLLTARWVRRRTKLGLAQVRGDRQHLEALQALIRNSLSLAELHDAGVRMDPQMALTLVSLMIEPSWTKGEKFTLALEEAGTASAFLKIRGRSRPRVLEAESAERVTTTVVVEAKSLLAVLAGDRAAATEIRGDERALSTLLEWIKRAQCG
jgi:hypothetical protein